MNSLDVNPSRNWQRSPVDQMTAYGTSHFRFDDSSDAENPFNQKPYDYDDGFYKGTFDFEDPVTGASLTGTPEVYGRRRIVAALAATVISRPESALTVLDLGSGTLDIARAIPDPLRARIDILNSDISGPWTPPESNSSAAPGASG